MSIEHQILDQIRARLEAMSPAPNVYLGKAIDPAHDALPAVSVVVSEPFNMRDEQIRPALRWRGRFDIEVYLEASGEDPLPTVMDYAADIRRAIYTPTDPTMGGICSEHRPVSSHPMVPEPGSKTGGAVVGLQVDFVENYT